MRPGTRVTTKRAKDLRIGTIVSVLPGGHWYGRDWPERARVRWLNGTLAGGTRPTTSTVALASLVEATDELMQRRRAVARAQRAAWRAERDARRTWEAAGA